MEKVIKQNGEQQDVKLLIIKKSRSVDIVRQILDMIGVFE
jgi:hypothetical protein